MNTDTRFLHTEEKIRTSFLELMQKVGFQKITVRMLIEKAGINRSTFYLHYEDKYALLYAMEDEILDEVRDFFHAQLEEQHLVREDGSLNPEQLCKVDSQLFIQHAATFVEGHQEQFGLLAGPKGDPEFMKRYGHNIWELLLEAHILPDLNETGEVYASAAFEGVISSMFSVWIQRGFQESAEEYFTIVSEILDQVSSTAVLIGRVTAP